MSVRKNLTIAGATTGLAVSLFGFTGPAFADTATPGATTQPMPTQTVEKDDDGDNGLWGLAGLLGLAGLAGLMKRPKETVRAAPATHAVRTDNVHTDTVRGTKAGGVDGNPNTRV